MRRIVVDSSAIVAILFQEDGHQALHDVLRARDVEMLIGAPTLVEVHMVLTGRRRREPAVIVGTILAGKRHQIVAFDEGMVRTAQEAFDEFGKGRHPAALNFGDCLSYAIARSFDLPLLFKGKDFACTDVKRAL